MPAPRSWIIGSAADCDLVVDRPTVSGRHCRLTRDAEGYVLEDLGSSNGTFVNGQRIVGGLRVGPRDPITLGTNVPLPWPDDALPLHLPSASGTTTLIRIGRSPENDVVIDDPRVSEYHARVLVEGPGGTITIEDLGSTNGTSLNGTGTRITRARLTESDQVYFGTYAIPAPRLLGRAREVRGDGPGVLTFRGEAMVLGRDADCDAVFDLPVVSGRHARLSRSGEDVVIEDLGSSNGTFVNGRRVQGRPAVVRAGDEIGLGKLKLRLVVMLRRERAAEDREPVDSLPSIALAPEDDVAPTGRPAAASVGAGMSLPAEQGRGRGVGEPREAAGTSFPGLAWRLAPVPVLAIALALAIVALNGGRTRASITPENWHETSVAIGNTLFALGLAAIGCGCVAGLDLGRRIAATSRGVKGVGAPWEAAAWAGGLGFVGCVTLLTIVHAGSALEGSWPLMLVALIAAMLAGLALGALAGRLAWSTRAAIGFLLLASLPLIFLGGAWPPRTVLPGPLRLVAQALPSRWVFEALLVLESDRRPPLAPPPQPDSEPGSGLRHQAVQDIAEQLFPAETERMGPRASLLALGAWTLGLVAGALLIGGGQRSPGHASADDEAFAL